LAPLGGCPTCHTVLTVCSPVLEQLLLRRVPRFHVRSGAGDLLAAQVDGGDHPTEGLVTAPGAQVDLQLDKIRQLD